MNNFKRMSFEANGFAGFVRVPELRDGSRNQIPNGPGVYVVLREHEPQPEFLAVSKGGHFKGKDPTVLPNILVERWIVGEHLVYVGQSKNLRDRVSGLVKFGSGKAVGHWGGRYLWQVADCDELVVGWISTDTHESAQAMERTVLAAFLDRFGRLPYANINFPRE